MKFRKKPVVIEAIQWNGNNYSEISEFVNDEINYTEYLGSTQLEIPTLEGKLFANVGDWIIKGIKGEYYPCKPDIFEATYESVGFALSENDI